MGAWGLLFDENDDAADWLGEFSEGPSWDVVDQTFAAIESDYVEAPDASQALAAAEVVAAALGKPSDRLSAEITEWAKQNFSGGGTRRGAATQVLTRVRDDSELHELWQESDEYPDWKSSVDETLSRLG